MRRSSSEIAPRDGFSLLLILPGGDGSEEFKVFCRSITERAIVDGMIVVQLVAPAWSGKEDRVVWPTQSSNPEKGRFTTEEFIDAVIEDLAKVIPVDRKRIVALGWSSSGPALFNELLRAKTPITGWIIAMSVFHPKAFTDDTRAVVSGRRVYLLHSPDDQLIKLQQHAAKAEKRLNELGAETTLVTYPGGHGWTDDPFGRIKTAIEWIARPPSKGP